MLEELSELNNLPLYFIVFAGLITGLTGSVHCTGMCGGLVAALTHDRRGIISYHLGRLSGYLTLGLIIPLLGIETLGLKDNTTLTLFAAVSLGLTFIYIGLKGIFNWKISFSFHGKLERLNQSIWANLFKSFKNSYLMRTFLGGSASALLPCGLLWTIIILSLTATSPLNSLLFIVSFWMGTTPALSFAPTIAKRILAPLQRRLPKTVPIFFIVIGLLTITTRIYTMFNNIGNYTCH